MDELIVVSIGLRNQRLYTCGGVWLMVLCGGDERIMIPKTQRVPKVVYLSYNNEFI